MSTPILIWLWTIGFVATLMLLFRIPPKPTGSGEICWNIILAMTWPVVWPACFVVAFCMKVLDLRKEE